jgi:hypothetical protein
MDNTSFDHVHANVADTRINQLQYEGWRYRMNINDAHRVLGGQSGGGRHCIAAMSGNDLLVCFQAPMNL